ncbi:CRP/FNR family nitrogen fixation transcriptional regulator [Bradyrhizobium japonicum]|uniref:CRP/FNR family nitrogen fixation transcriptional regulator n=1 Tax=Bradyrhizobium japonicum TaxID=375 RepID=A0ABV2RS38_BRAJP|nr:helix-turn-helix domain-containing protein [Bradyrhizobium japonicum]UQD97623.1 helix-turn-helix domain-containing protein [Bradyrhizobium japonicum]WLB21614.1 helix-turn-helix domain-containing protein [Bradyrhizobium japonicum]
MLVRVTADRVSLPLLGDVVIPSGLGASFSVREFTYRKGQEVYGENEPAEYVYQVLNGAVRRYKLLSDGRRQIGAFHLSGDIFGFENVPVRRFTAEAVVETRIRLINRQSLEDVPETDANVFHNLLSMTTRNLRHAEDHMLLLGRKSSTEKIAAFLLEMDGRLTRAGMLSLPMSRRDIADYLGLTIETVSRAVCRFQREGVLEFTGKSHRAIVILDRQRLLSFDMPS